MLQPAHVEGSGGVELVADSGFTVRLVGLGAGISSLKVPGRSGVVDVVLGYEDDAAYRDDPWFMGSTVGRYANRLSHGRLSLGQNTFQLSTDPATGHCLHGGEDGFHRQDWQLEEFVDGCRAVFRHVSPHGTGGFPGRLDARVVYTVIEPSSLAIEFLVTTDRATVVSMTNHAYFNLHGTGESVAGHTLRINADRYLPVDGEGIPVGVMAGVDDTSFDFRTPRVLRSSDIYDTGFVLNAGDDYLRHVATLASPISGISMNVHTTQPTMQLYTGDSLSDPFFPRAGLCLETQHFTDAPNQAQFPDATVNATETYRQQTIYEFSVEDQR